MIAGCADLSFQNLKSLGLALITLLWINHSTFAADVQNAASPLGINLSPGGDYPFLNAMWNTAFGSWGSVGGGIPLSDLALDAQGWPLSSSKGGSGTTYTDGLNFPLQTRPQDTNQTVFCIGQATVFLQGSGGASVSCPSTGGTAITVPNIFTGKITNDDQTANGSHLTALAIVPTVYASKFASAGCLTNPGQVACVNPDFVTTNGPFRVFRWMDYTNTNDPTNPTTNWASRPLTTQPFYNGASLQSYFNGQTIPEGMPAEMEVAVCNAADASCWLNFPIGTTTDFAAHLAQYVSANLNQNAFYEYVNEPWNTNPLRTALENLGATAFSTSASFVAGMSYYQKQADSLMAQVTSNSSNSRYFRVLGLGQNQNSQGSTCGNCANYWWLGGPTQGNLWSGWTLSHFDVSALAPYFGTGIPDAWGDPTLLGRLFSQIQTGGQFPDTTGANTTTGSSNNYVLASSSACGNGTIPSTPSNGTITCFKPNFTNTGNSTLTVDGGTTYPFYWPRSSSNSISSYQLSAGQITATGCGGGPCTTIVTFTTTTGASAWNSGTTYSAGFPVVGSDGNTYYSTAGSNTNNNPVGDGNVALATNHTCMVGLQ